MAHTLAASQLALSVGLSVPASHASARSSFRGAAALAPLRAFPSSTSESSASAQPAAVRRGLVTCRVAEQAGSDADVPTTGIQKGWSYAEYGTRDVLRFGDVELPELEANQVLIRVAAAALNPVDFKRREGKFKASDSALPTVPGYDVAGTVVRVGSAVSSLKPGDEVYSDISRAALEQPKRVGSLAQFTATEADLVALKPKNLSFLEAASIPLAALTAAEAFDRADFKKGQSVLILNGAGGVGTLAIQLAKKVYGAAFVAATASLPKTGLLEGLGADLVLDYKSDFTKLPQLYDFVFDCVGEGDRAVQVVKPGGKVIVLTGPTPPPAERFVVTSSGERLARLTPFFESGAVRPVLDPKGQFKFSDVVSAFEHLESGRATGKVVVGPIA
eukprot:TRINITY_DN26506_c0_g1_i1.p1 TRINITY_DN26506_c0_g1~~TRINITY_DN26506_c0_g1_i1.p1  ORF type:complete len:420 (+),score=23.62 TRINITY_DN26506_c0_g1_i1:94-1260(+)